MKVTLMLADAAQVADGKLYILGGGWSAIVPGGPFAVAGKIEVPYDRATETHEWRLELVDADGQPVLVHPALDAEPQPLVLSGSFSTGIPPHVVPGTPLDSVIAANFAPGLPLAPSSRYQWRFSIDGQEDEDWSLGFSTRAAPTS